MQDSAVFQNVLGVFAHYGFRKTSMSDLAGAANVSRQTLYNRFRTKNAVLDWAVEGYVAQTALQATQHLSAKDRPVRQRLLNAFSKWLGESVPVMHNSPHGAEIMDLGAASLQRSDVNPYLQFETALCRFLLDEGICKTQQEAEDKTFLLLIASKGLLLKSASSEEFEAGMTRIINSAISDGA